MTTTTHDIPQFRVRSRLGVIRDVLVIGVCVALMIGFIAQVWNAPAPVELRSAVSPAAASVPA